MDKFQKELDQLLQQNQNLELTIKVNKAETEKNKAETEKNKAETEKNKAETEKNKAETEKNKAETEKNKSLIELMDVITKSVIELNDKNISNETIMKIIDKLFESKQNV
jgi:uncharacterized protein (DUF3084 family)